MPKFTRGARVAALIAAGTAVAALSGCGSSSSSTTAADQPIAATGSRDSGSLKSALPADLQHGSSIPVAAVSDYPPISYIEAGGSQIQGVAIDILNAAADVLGVKFDYQNTSFDSLVPALQAGRGKIASGGATDTAANEESTEMVDYMKAGVQLIVPKGNPDKISSLDDVCGRTVAVLSGSTYGKLLATASGKCTSAGKPKITVSTFQTADEAILALKAGRVDAEFDSNVAQAYRITQGADIEVAGPSYASVPIAFQLLPADKQLATALNESIQKLIDNGTYKKLLAKWDLTSAALPKAGIDLGK